MKRPVLALLTLGLAILPACQTTPGSGEDGAPKAQLFDGLGPHGRPISTGSAKAQKYFDQGLNWMYAFNHDEAIRSFTKAGELDPDCAMAWWGVALCQGPNYNDPMMTDARNNAAWEALQKAQARIANTTPVERALIEALSHRYANPAPADRSGLEKAYADAMAEVWAEYPYDADVGTLYAEAMMVRMPWKLWDLEYKPAGDTPKILAALERSMSLAPNNPGAKHLYIHATEQSAAPDRGLVAANQLDDLVPGAGHLRHMPSHTYVKTGFWDRAVEQNAEAMEADAKYRAKSPDQGIQHLYMVHNCHMRAFAALMSGRETEAMEAARAMWANVPDEAMRAVGPVFDLWMCSVYDVQKRFGRWDDLLAEPAPPDYLPVTMAIWRAHRAIAYAAKKDFDNARREQALFREAKAALPEDLVAVWDLAHKVLDISDKFIEGEILLQQGDWDAAAKLLEEGAALEDALSYGEPPQWLQPIRHTLGAVYLKSGRNADAERVYREDLRDWPDNGWSLFGLSTALERQGKAAEAAKFWKRYEAAWHLADAPITTSCECIPRV